MKKCHTVIELQNELKQFHKENSSVGFVPTMGALHEGHISLIKRSVKENTATVCSIFVNPTQFNNSDDLAKYPRTEYSDIKMLEENKCSIVFIPSVKEIYPDKKMLDIDFGLLETCMEGIYRPGHFKGVATVVKKLFDIVQPDTAYFGEKDFQQLAIIRNMVQQLKIKIKIEGCPTVREHDGLAMSSRNIHLTSEERMLAPVIYHSLRSAKEEFRKKIPINEIKNHVGEKIEKSNVFKLQYFEVVNAETLQAVNDNKKNIPVQACIAVLALQTRLIDNIALHLVSQN